MTRSRLALSLLLATACVPAATSPAQAQLFVGVSVRLAPPPLPIYVQPALPGPDYIWLPGFWSWDDYAGDYFWVPGTWVLAPRPGYVWTPPWWEWRGGGYGFHEGYWGPHVGWYGGISYGFGYTGYGYQGGYWNGPHFFYNRSVNNVTNVNVTNVYSKTVVVNKTVVNNVSYAGGAGGVRAQPTPALLAANNEPHLAATAQQTQHIAAARGSRALFASVNRGAPPVGATAQAGRFTGQGILRARAPGGVQPARAPNGAPPAPQQRGTAVQRQPLRGGPGGGQGQRQQFASPPPRPQAPPNPRPPAPPRPQPPHPQPPRPHNPPPHRAPPPHEGGPQEHRHD